MDTRDKAKIGIIGGSGLYEMEGLADEELLDLDTPFGRPSSALRLGEFASRRVAFIARHGEGHILSPSEINYRANIYALKSIGVERVIAVSACGSLREDFAPGEVVVPNQLYDNTRLRKSSFFEGGLVAHVDVADPFCHELSAYLAESVEAVEGVVHRGGSYITIEGPRFSTRAESNTYRAWGMSIVGMTTCPEAFLAREAEMCFAVFAHVTDYDVWRTAEEPVTVEVVLRVLQQNTDLARRALGHLLSALPVERSCDCHQALKSALTTQPDYVGDDARRRLHPLVHPYLD